ncbi:MAG: hypothetical protein HQL58_00585 [Magnetococcales bacterium]|nr:hypothetical protein [Magnetococcales bacterium]
MPSPPVATIAVERLIYGLLLASLALLTIHEVNFFSGYFLAWIPSEHLIELFDITLEANLPTWFSSSLFLLCGLSAWAVSRSVAERTGRWERCHAWCWRVIALFFLYDWMDDSSQIHERLGSTIGDSLKTPLVQHFLSYYWHLLFLPILVSMGLILLVLWYRLPNWTLRLQLLTGLSCLTLAVGLDYLEGLDWFMENMRQYYASHGLSLSILRHLLRSGEEWLEMVGCIFIAASFLGTARELSTTLLLRLR